MRPVQYFTTEYLEYCRSLTATERVRFIEQYQRICYAGSTRAANDDCSPKVGVTAFLGQSHIANTDGIVSRPAI